MRKPPEGSSFRLHELDELTRMFYGCFSEQEWTDKFKSLPALTQIEIALSLGVISEEAIREWGEGEGYDGECH